MRARERAQATLEFAALVPLVLGLLVAALQVMAMAYTAHGAAQAARDGARAYSLGQSAVAAARASLPGGVRLVNVRSTGPEHTVVVTAEPPLKMLPFVSDYTVTRSVTMP